MRSERRTIQDYSDFSLDSSVFHNRKLTFSQALVIHLKEEKKQSYADIARMLGRDQRTIWTQYQTAIQHIGTNSYRFLATGTNIPLSALQREGCSLMEAAILYLRSQGKKNKEIATALARSERTISSLLVRLRKRGDLK